MSVKWKMHNQITKSNKILNIVETTWVPPDINLLRSDVYELECIKYVSILDYSFWTDYKYFTMSFKKDKISYICIIDWHSKNCVIYQITPILIDKLKTHFAFKTYNNTIIPVIKFLDLKIKNTQDIILINLINRIINII